MPGLSLTDMIDRAEKKDRSKSLTQMIAEREKPKRTSARPSAAYAGPGIGQTIAVPKPNYKPSAKSMRDTTDLLTGEILARQNQPVGFGTGDVERETKRSLGLAPPEGAFPLRELSSREVLAAGLVGGIQVPMKASLAAMQGAKGALARGAFRAGAGAVENVGFGIVAQPPGIARPFSEWGQSLPVEAGFGAAMRGVAGGILGDAPKQRVAPTPDAAPAPRPGGPGAFGVDISEALLKRPKVPKAPKEKLPKEVRQLRREAKIAEQEREWQIVAEHKYEKGLADTVTEYIGSVKRYAPQNGLRLVKTFERGKGTKRKIITQELKADLRTQDISEIARDMSMTPEEFAEWAGPIIRKQSGGEFKIQGPKGTRHAGELDDMITAYELGILHEALTGKKARIAPVVKFAKAEKVENVPNLELKPKQTRTKPALLPETGKLPETGPVFGDVKQKGGVYDKPHDLTLETPGGIKAPDTTGNIFEQPAPTVAKNAPVEAAKPAEAGTGWKYEGMKQEGKGGPIVHRFTGPDGKTHWLPRSGGAEIPARKGSGVPEDVRLVAQEELAGKIEAGRTEAPAAGGTPSRLDAREAEVRARIEARRNQPAPEVPQGKKGQRGAVINPFDDLTDYIELGAIKIAKGTVKLADWSREMVSEFGDAIKPHLKKIWMSARKYHKDTLETELDPIKFMNKAIRESKPARVETEMVRSVERGRRTGKAIAMRERALAKGGTPEEAFIASKGSYKGELPKPPDLEPISLPDNVRQDLIGHIQQSPEIPPHHEYTRVAMVTAFRDLVDNGVLPRGRELEQLSKIFGPEWTDAILSKAPWYVRALRGFGEVLNFQRLFQTGFDESWALNQGIPVLFRSPRVWGRAMKKGYASLSKVKSEAIQQEMMLDSDFGRFTDAGMHFTRMESPSPATREEAFIGLRLLKRIPGVKYLGKAIEPFGRGYTNAGNYARFSLLKGYVRTFGDSITPKQLSNYADFGNKLTGRGNLGSLEDYASFLNGLAYAARFTAAQWQLPAKMVSRDARVRRQAAATFASWIPTVIGIGLTMKATETGDIELDPRSSRFLRIRIGETDTWVDLTMGLGRIAALVTQVFGGYRKEVRSSDIAKVAVDDAIWQYARGKAAPGVSTYIDFRTGKTIVGEKRNVKEVESWLAEASETFPLWVQDVVDIWKGENELTATLFTPFAYHGLRIQHYENKPTTSGGVPDIGREIQKSISLTGK